MKFTIFSMLLLSAGHLLGQVTSPNNFPTLGNYVGFDGGSTIPLPIRNDGDPRLTLGSNGSTKFSLTEQPVWNGLNGLVRNNVQRTTMGLQGQTNEAWSILHFWDTAAGTVPLQLRRRWMNVGLTGVANIDIFHLGLIERPIEGGNNLLTDAVMAWGCQNTEALADNLRFIFISPTTMQGISAQEQGLETMRITPWGNVGIGNFSSTPGGLFAQPRARLDVQFFGDYPLATANIAVNVNNVVNPQGPGITVFKTGIDATASTVPGEEADRVTGGDFLAEGGRQPRGVYGTARRDDVFPQSNAVGVEGEVLLNADGAFNIGVRGRASNTSDAAAGIFAFAPTANPNNVAAFLQGDVVITGNVSGGSDEALKHNVEEIEDAHSKLMALNPVKYEFKTEELPHMSLAQGIQYGLIAQQVEETMPELVTNAKSPEVYNDENELVQESMEFKAVKYDLLIPLLIKAYQEENIQNSANQEVIDELVQRLNNLEEQLAACCSAPISAPGSGSDKSMNGDATPTDQLHQNIPNPFKEQTTINFELVSDSQVLLEITDSKGNLVATLVNGSMARGQHRVEWNASGQAPGTYYYSLYTNKELLTKKMIKL